MELKFKKEEIASFDVDAQKTFTPVCPDELPVPDGDTIVNELNTQAQYCTIRVGSKDAHCLKAVWLASENHPQFERVEGYKDVDIRWNSHAIMGTKGAELLDGLPEINNYDFFIWKGIEPTMHPYGACYHDYAEKLSTGVIEFLQSKKIKAIVIGGLATDYCVKMTALQLAKAGFFIIVNLGACRGIEKETINSAIHEMKKHNITFVSTANELTRYIDE